MGEKLTDKRSLTYDQAKHILDTYRRDLDELAELGIEFRKEYLEYLDYDQILEASRVVTLYQTELAAMAIGQSTDDLSVDMPVPQLIESADISISHGLEPVTDFPGAETALAQMALSDEVKLYPIVPTILVEDFAPLPTKKELEEAKIRKYLRDLEAAYAEGYIATVTIHTKSSKASFAEKALNKKYIGLLNAQAGERGHFVHDEALLQGVQAELSRLLEIGIPDKGDKSGALSVVFGHMLANEYGRYMEENGPDILRENPVFFILQLLRCMKSSNMNGQSTHYSGDVRMFEIILKKFNFVNEPTLILDIAEAAIDFVRANQDALNSVAVESIFELFVSGKPISHKHKSMVEATNMIYQISATNPDCLSAEQYYRARYYLFVLTDGTSQMLGQVDNPGKVLDSNLGLRRLKSGQLKSDDYGLTLEDVQFFEGLDPGKVPSNESSIYEFTPHFMSTRHYEKLQFVLEHIVPDMAGTSVLDAHILRLKQIQGSDSQAAKSIKRSAIPISPLLTYDFIHYEPDVNATDADPSLSSFLEMARVGLKTATEQQAKLEQNPYYFELINTTVDGKITIGCIRRRSIFDNIMVLQVPNVLGLCLAQDADISPKTIESLTDQIDVVREDLLNRQNYFVGRRVLEFDVPEQLKKQGFKGIQIRRTGQHEHEVILKHADRDIPIKLLPYLPLKMNYESESEQYMAFLSARIQLIMLELIRS